MNNYFLVLLIGLMVVFMWWSSRSRKKQMAQMETTDGHEMYWEREMIAEIGAVPPLAENADNETQESADVEEPADEDDTVLGLDESARDGSGASEPDEQQK